MNAARFGSARHIAAVDVDESQVELIHDLLGCRNIERADIVPRASNVSIRELTFA